jgi:glutaredoxin
MRLLLRGLVPVLAALSALPAHALYKVVGPDGRVTYTDRAPAPDAGPGRVQPFKAGQMGEAPEQPTLPYELRQVVQRFPVVLYTAADCGPCDSARELLQQRGVPFTERLLVTEDDAKAFERLGGSRSLPGLGIGAQQLRGLATADWHAYLDAAGYPKAGRLPRGWKAPTPQPLTAPRTAAPAAETPESTVSRPAAAPARRATPASAPTATTTASGFRF